MENILEMIQKLAMSRKQKHPQNDEIQPLLLSRDDDDRTPQTEMSTDNVLTEVPPKEVVVQEESQPSEELLSQNGESQTNEPETEKKPDDAENEDSPLVIQQVQSTDIFPENAYPCDTLYEDMSGLMDGMKIKFYEFFIFMCGLFNTIKKLFVEAQDALTEAVTEVLDQESEPETNDDNEVSGSKTEKDGLQKTMKKVVFGSFPEDLFESLREIDASEYLNAMKKSFSATFQKIYLNHFMILMGDLMRQSIWMR